MFDVEKYITKENDDALYSFFRFVNRFENANAGNGT